MTVAKKEKVIQTDTFRLSAQETRAIWAMAQAGDKPTNHYAALSLAELGFAKQVNFPKKDVTSAIEQSWKDLQSAASDKNLRGVTSAASKLENLQRQEREAVKGYVLTPLGKQIARGVAVRLSSQFS